jgi:hypothetical protein
MGNYMFWEKIELLKNRTSTVFLFYFKFINNRHNELFLLNFYKWLVLLKNCFYCQIIILL